jgi:hypothetical protein
VTEDRKLVEQLEEMAAGMDRGSLKPLFQKDLFRAAADRIRALEGEREQIYEAAVETGRLEARIADAEREAALARAERLQAQVEELREGLRPFAEACQDADNLEVHPNMAAWESSMAMAVSYGDFRRAHSLLSKQEKEG